VTSTGHSNQKITNALQQQLDQKLIHTYTFASEIRAKFLKKLIDITPEYLEKGFLLSSGTEATECTVKLMRMYGQSIRPTKLGVISFKENMHGRTMVAEMLKGNLKLSSWIGFKDPNIHNLPFPYPWLTDESNYNWENHFQNDMQSLGNHGLNFDDICGFIIESYQGWGGIFYPKEYMKALEKFAKKHDILIAFDEIQGGLGRTGKLFVYQHYDIEPDLVCLGKALGGGLPLSAVIGRRKIMDLPETGSMSSTHSANPLCCAAGYANLVSLEEENLIAESEKKGEVLHNRLNEIKNKYPNRISNIYGKGLLAGLIIVNPETQKPDSLFASKVCEKAMQKGLLLVHTGREAIKMGPPFTITDEALNEGLKVFDETIAEVAGEKIIYESN
jgi:4-aminobutyrate aminotransferase-like enzyme